MQTGDMLDRGPDSLGLVRFFEGLKVKALRPGDVKSCCMCPAPCSRQPSQLRTSGLALNTGSLFNSELRCPQHALMGPIKSHQGPWLQAQAADAGGKVHTLLGNHCVMNLMGNYDYVSPDELRNLALAGGASRGASQQALQQKGLQAWHQQMQEVSSARLLRAGALNRYTYAMQYIHAKPYASRAARVQAKSQLCALQDTICKMKPAICQQEPSRFACSSTYQCAFSTASCPALQSNSIGAALRAREAAVVAGEGQCRTLFVHAGLLPAVLQKAAGDAGLDGAVVTTPEKLIAALQQAVSGEPGLPVVLIQFASSDVALPKSPKAPINISLC